MTDKMSLNQKIEKLDGEVEWFYSDEFKLEQAVEKYKETSGKPYKLSAAVGGKVFDFSSDDTKDLVVVIDELMYKDKNDYYKTNERKR